ncbi:hypothetical protein PYCC9005_000270 [Savitreella phatthalungensis]
MLQTIEVNCLSALEQKAIMRSPSSQRSKRGLDEIDDDATPRSRHTEKRLVMGAGERPSHRPSPITNPILPEIISTLAKSTPGDDNSRAGALSAAYCHSVERFNIANGSHEQQTDGTLTCFATNLLRHSDEAREERRRPVIIDERQENGYADYCSANRGEEADHDGKSQFGDLLSFRTPDRALGRSQLSKLRTDNGEEFLLDVTPCVYSPSSIPIYTLRDIETIKSDFELKTRELERQLRDLRGELAASVSNADHNAALIAQSESLHTEYSKKHIRKVTTLKKDWEARHNEKMKEKDEQLARCDEEVSAQRARIDDLAALLQIERREKQEVIEMGEQILCMFGASSHSEKEAHSE